MSRGPSERSPVETDETAVDDRDVHVPFTGRGARSTSGEHPREDNMSGDGLLDDSFDMPSAAATRMRPAPKELSRRDRLEWRRLEVTRISRAARTASAHRHTPSHSWSGGFISTPPRGLGRKGRKAWRLAEHEATTQWWAQRRASNTDIDARMAGAAVLALVIGIAVIAAVAVHRTDPARSTGPSLEQTASTTGRFTAAPSATPVTSLPTVPGATGSVAVASRNAAVARTPMVPPPVSGRWQPTPAGGVPPITPIPRTADTAIPPVLTPMTGAFTAADQGSAEAVMTSWLARTCPSSWLNQFGADMNRGKALETAAGWQQDDPARDPVGAALWRSVAVAHRQTRRCGHVAVTVSPDQRLTAHGGFVLYSVDRVVTSADGLSPPTVEHLSGARRVVASNGKWLVDVPVVGG